MNMDRFKFKAIIKVDYCDKNEEDKVVNLVIENVAVENGDVGFSESELTKTLDKLSLTDEEIENISVYLFDNYGIDYGNDTYFWCDKAKIIQCTGLKDKNGNLIYEEDLIKTANYKTGRPEIYVVKWCDECGLYQLESTQSDQIIDMFRAERGIICGNAQVKGAKNE